MTSGILLVDKPGGITSHDVVARVRKLAGMRKVGHSGTLDPMATGLLVLGLGSSTRLLTFLVGLDKEYFATIRLGRATTSDDAEGEPLGEVADTSALDVELIGRAMAELTGDIMQRPSAVSAIKVDGKRAYSLVRDGETVELAQRPVTVRAFEPIALRRGEWLDLDVRVECTSGTYVRALARDLGAALGVGGHLVALRRTRVGPFSVTDAGELDEHVLEGLRGPASVAARLFPTVSLSDAETADLSNGKRVAVAGEQPSGPLAALAPDGRLIGLIDIVEGRTRVLSNFPTGDHLERRDRQ